MSEGWRLSAEEIAHGVRDGKLSAVEVVESCLQRIAEVEPRVGAFLEIFEQQARQRAAEIDGRRQFGEELGPLAGVPVALKDNLNIAGQSLTCASRILQGYVAPYSATAVARLVEAGAVLVGRTNMDEFAMGSSCENSSVQPTRNPWHLGRVPGGSSGGSAAAVAAGAAPIALGSDTGGSIRQPAALCGIVGVKPSYGRVSRYGLVAFASSLDQIGPFSRTVRDSALALQAIAGADPRDATTLQEPVEDYLESIEEGCEGVRVGVVREIDVAELDAASGRIWRRSLERLEALGAELVEISVPNVPVAIATYYVIANSEASANLARFDGIRYGRRASGAKDLLDLYLRSRSEGFGREVKRRIMLGTFALSSGYYEAYYGRARGVQEELRRQFTRAFEEVDAIVTPTTPGGAFGLGEKVDRPLEMYLSDIFTAPANLAGLPAVAIPSGQDDEGLPLSLQITSPLRGEAIALRIARAFEVSATWQVAPAFVEAGDAPAAGAGQGARGR